MEQHGTDDTESKPSPTRGRPAPPKRGRPAPPARGPPAPPDTSPRDSSEFVGEHGKKNDSAEPTILERARKLELEENYDEAAILYRQLGLLDKENLCLSLALTKAKSSGVTNIHYGDKIVKDSVIMKDD